MSRHARHRARRELSAAHIGVALLPILATVMVAVAVSSGAHDARSATLSGPPAHTATHAAAGQEWPRIPSSVPLPPVRIDGVTASR